MALSGARGQRDDEATTHHPAVDDDDDGGELPPDLPDAPPDFDEPLVSPRRAGLTVAPTLGGAAAPRVSTGAQFSMPVMTDDPDAPPMAPGRLENHRSPAPSRQRPTLLPAAFDHPPKLPTASKTNEPGLMRPVRSNQEQPRGPINLNKESSDVINTYDTANSGEPRRATLHPIAPPRTQPPGPGQFQPVSRVAARRVPTAPPPAHVVRPVPPPPGPLPLNADVMVGLIAAHRARLTTLDMYARSLEISAGVVATTAGGFLIASLVALLVGHGNTLLGAAAALVSEVAGIGVAVAMLAGAAALRHLASTAAQTAALLEALSSNR